jgi:hypothetical protein
MKRDVDAISTPQAKQEGRTNLLLRHCLSLGAAENRVPARVRLDQAVGPDLARRLVTSLTAHGRK